MFKFLKEKLQKTLSKFSKEVKSKSEEVPAVETTPEITQIKDKIKPKKIKRDKSKKLIKPFEQITKEIEDKQKIDEKIREVLEPEKKGFIKRITEKVTTKKLPEKQFDSIFEELEIALLENNVALEVIDKIKRDLKEQLVEKPIFRKNIDLAIKETLKKSLEELGEGLGIWPCGVGRILYVMGLKPMHGTRKRRYNPSKNHNRNL